MRRFYIWCADHLMKLWDLPQLLFRLMLAYGFYAPMMEKAKHFQDVVAWFASMGYPAPTLAASAAITTEILGIVLLPLGLLTRLISIPLIFLLSVAIATVHWSHGFPASGNGWEIPFYYCLMLLSLVIIGPGRISLDALIARKIRAERRRQSEQKKLQQAISAGHRASLKAPESPSQGHQS